MEIDIQSLRVIVETCYHLSILAICGRLVFWLVVQDKQLHVRILVEYLIIYLRILLLMILKMCRLLLFNFSFMSLFVGVLPSIRQQSSPS